MCSHISLALLVAAPTSLAINVQPSVRSIGSFATSTPFPSLAVQKGPTRIFDVLAPLERLAAQYEQLMDNHYLSLSAAQAGTLRGVRKVYAYMICTVRENGLARILYLQLGFYFYSRCPRRRPMC